MVGIRARRVTRINDKFTKHCGGCGIFCCAEYLQLRNGGLWLCGNCMEFCTLAANEIVKQDLGVGTMRRILRGIRNKKRKAKKTI